MAAFRYTAVPQLRDKRLLIAYMLEHRLCGFQELADALGCTKEQIRYAFVRLGISRTEQSSLRLKIKYGKR